MKLDNIFNKFNQISKVKLHIFLQITFFITAIIFTYISVKIWDYQLIENEFKKMSQIKFFFVAVILAPLFETFVFTYLPFKLLSKKIKLEYVIFIASFLFGIQHFYSVVYIIFGIIAGFILNIYYSYLLKYNNKYAFLLVVLLHSVANLISTILEFLDKHFS